MVVVGLDVAAGLSSLHRVPKEPEIFLLHLSFNSRNINLTQLVCLLSVMKQTDCVAPWAHEVPQACHCKRPSLVYFLERSAHGSHRTWDIDGHTEIGGGEMTLDPLSPDERLWFPLE